MRYPSATGSSSSGGITLFSSRGGRSLILPSSSRPSRANPASRSRPMTSWWSRHPGGETPSRRGCSSSSCGGTTSLSSFSRRTTPGRDASPSWSRSRNPSISPARSSGGRHPEQHLLCSSGELTGIITQGTGDGVELGGPLRVSGFTWMRWFQWRRIPCKLVYFPEIPWWNGKTVPFPFI